MIRFIALVSALVLAAIVAVGVFGRGNSEAAAPTAHMHQTAAGPGGKAADLRVTLDRLFGEHALLAITATRKGYDGDPDFKIAATTLDKNSVELAAAIGSVYGVKARNQFLNGRFMWRDHIRFFVDYTVALKKRDRAGQRQAVANLKTYVGRFSGFLATATKLPQNAVRASITAHVGHLKGQIDAYGAKRYQRAYRLQRVAYSHMFATGDTVAGAIAKQFPARFGS